jgi:hypothetical protein
MKNTKTPKSPTKITAARALYTLDRAMREKLLERVFGTEELVKASEYFRSVGVNGCIYCGRLQVERWDHLVSVRAGGATVLGNMVPACQQCDDSKGPKDYRDWLSGTARYNPARGNPPVYEKIIQKVEAYQKHFSYIPPLDFDSALQPVQRTQYSTFIKKLAEFRIQLAAFDLIAAQATEEEQSEVDEI